jgi:succinyl-diaminopimelate desuccinylase
MEKEQSLELLSNLVSFRTTKDNPNEILRCYDFVSKELAELPFAVKTYEKNGVVSMLWESPYENKILLNAHIDVVPASEDLFTLKHDGDRILGRGVSDMKFGVASFVTAIKDIYKKTGSIPPIDMLLTADEESGGSNGVGNFVNEHDLNYAVVIIPDGGDNWKIVEEAKGVLHLQIATKGKSAHASRPWEGESASEIMIEDLPKLRASFPQIKADKWETTLNIGQIHVGKQTNQVPDEGIALVDIRYIPDDKKIDIKNAVSFACSNSEVTPIVEADPFKIDKNNPYIQKWEKLISPYSEGQVFIKEPGASDGRYFTDKGIPVILSKPMGGLIHTEQEWLNLESFYQFTQLLTQYINEFENKS